MKVNNRRVPDGMEWELRPSRPAESKSFFFFVCGCLLWLVDNGHWVKRTVHPSYVLKVSLDLEKTHKDLVRGQWCWRNIHVLSVECSRTEMSAGSLCASVYLLLSLISTLLDYCLLGLWSTTRLDSKINVILLQHLHDHFFDCDFNCIFLLLYLMSPFC